MRALVIVCALAATARAGAIVAPAGWTKGASKTAAIEVYVSPGDAVELVVSTNGAALAVGNRADATRAALDDVHEIAKRAALTSEHVAVDSWQERTDAAAKHAEGTLVWRDPDGKMKETARIVIAGDAKRLVAVTGECIARDDAAAELVTACTTALATLDPGIAVADRLAPAIAAPGTPPKPIVELAPDVNNPPRPAPSMSDGSHIPLPPIAVPRESPSTDRRPIFVGAGIVILAGVFWWNMRRRARYEEEDQENDDDR